MCCNGAPWRRVPGWLLLPLAPVAGGAFLVVLPVVGAFLVAKAVVEAVLGTVFKPFAFVMGVPWGEAGTVGALLGKRMVVNEFVAFIELGQLPLLSAKAKLISTFALCGFANFGSMGILIGGLSIMCPERRPDFLALSWKTLYAGTLATIMAAAVVGSLPYSLFKSDDSLTPVVQDATLAAIAPVAVEPAPIPPAPEGVAPAAPITTPAPTPDMVPAAPTPQTP